MGRWHSHRAACRRVRGRPVPACDPRRHARQAQRARRDQRRLRKSKESWKELLLAVVTVCHGLPGSRRSRRSFPPPARSAAVPQDRQRLERVTQIAACPRLKRSSGSGWPRPAKRLRALHQKATEKLAKDREAPSPSTTSRPSTERTCAPRAPATMSRGRRSKARRSCSSRRQRNHGAGIETPG